MVEPLTDAEYSIASVSKLTGVGCHALRVWERRYGFPVPRRSPSGHRRYGSDQVAILRQLARRLHDGESLCALMAEIRGEHAEISVEAPELAEVSQFGPLLDRLVVGDLVGAEAAYLSAAAGLSRVEHLSQLLRPGFVEVGERWFRGEWNIFQEHAATNFLREKLYGLLEAARSDNYVPRHSALIGTVQGDRHEGGALMLAVMLEITGWRAHFLGVDLPVPELQKAIDQWRPDAVAVSFALSRNINKRFSELAQLHGAPVYVGGRSLLNYQGLARRHGLHPLVGPCEETVQRMIREVESSARLVGPGGNRE